MGYYGFHCFFLYHNIVNSGVIIKISSILTFCHSVGAFGGKIKTISIFHSNRMVLLYMYVGPAHGIFKTGISIYILNAVKS